MVDPYRAENVRSGARVLSLSDALSPMRNMNDIHSCFWEPMKGHGRMVRPLSRSRMGCEGGRGMGFRLVRWKGCSCTCCCMYVCMRLALLP